MSDWPTNEDDFNKSNIWNLDVYEFIGYLEEVADIPFWLEDMDLKYINIRIDTRNGNFLLHTDKSNERESPDRIIKAVNKSLEG